MKKTNLITTAIEIVGIKELTKACNLKSYQAVRKWEKKGILPRTEWTGETNYSEVIERLTAGEVTKEMLLNRKAA